MAYRKICPECGQKSFSASKLGEWTCPYCGKDLTEIEAEDKNE